ncbi:DUF1007 family protein [Cocleimonas sp. KMM 6892]|uniref:DUF1007 family protein n=1 Tax=unclassified Cocleimonas TaxID=2639732 RepID=UPI002DB9F238|nr:MULTISPECIES: DUF1007 family protein [unclassified Cocleimonas]MEB8431325.1 DUF1007 family protein [Cocleimonas sp. KMM 6892]MEC4713903.1 DUF1007 family protein [Cocleimonas sp. KMM 6895]MEC4743234.1 DUF1007 family protein [Cocleimonas sp. KMM 6896]
MFKILSSSFFTSLFVLFVFSSQPAFSHGMHYEVQLKSELQANTDGQISGVGMVWVYDPIVSVDMLKDEPDLTKLGKSINNNLERFKFFTKIKSEDKTLSIGKAQNFKLEEVKYDKETNLQISFTLPFTSPPALGSVKKLTFDYSDPTATAILYYENPADVSLGFGLKEKCKTSLEEKPSFKEGEFPQIVTIICS